jgi:alpha-maltose-1-phosphate synthase
MPPRVLFVNGGILGLRSFYHFIEAMLPAQSRLAGEQILLTEGLTLGDRVRRRLICQRLWQDGWLGLRNLDLARWRHELHAGRLARRRIERIALQPDVIHFHRQATAYDSLDLMRRVPSIVSVDCTQVCVMQQARSRIERVSYAPNVRRDGRVFEVASWIVTTSQWAADSIRDMYPACQTPIEVMPDPVLFDWFDDAGWAERRRARAAAGSVPRLLFMGGDFPRKGGPLLLDAWVDGRFAARAELVLVTDWPLPAPLPSGVRQVSGVTAYSPEWAACWAEADAFVMPTRDEAFGLVFQEAAAAGLAAIGTRHNAIPEIILDGTTGLLIPVEDRAALIAAMDRLVGSPALRERLGLAARRHVEAIASPGPYFERLTDLVLALVAGRSAT